MALNYITLPDDDVIGWTAEKMSLDGGSKLGILK